MKREDNNTDKKSQLESDKKSSSHQSHDSEHNDYPGYPHYPASEDIYNQEKEVDLNTEDLTKVKSEPLKPGEPNEKDFRQDMTGEDLDVPGSKADEAKGKRGMEDEENNYYSLGGDRHTDLEEDNG